jgi:hypothetical protein
MFEWFFVWWAQLALETAWLKDFIAAEEENDAEGTFLSLSRIFNDQNNLVPLRKRPDSSVRFVVRDFYARMFDEIFLAAFAVEFQTLRVFVTGTPGTGKTTFRMYCAWRLLRMWKAQGKAGAVVMHKGGEDRYVVLAVRGGSGGVVAWEATGRQVRLLEGQYKLGETLFLLSDISQGNVGGTALLDGGLALFSSPNPKTWAQTRKQQCKFFFMPLWKLEELMYCDPNTPTGQLIFDRFLKYEGIVRYVWGSEDDVKEHEDSMDERVDFAELHKDLQAASWEFS